MRLAFITDIHGNPLALDAVLTQIEADGGVDGIWFLGDYCAIGYDPVAILERITALPNTVIIRGNTDRYLYAHELPEPTPEDALHDVGLIRRFGEVSRNFAWTQGVLAHTGWLDWLEALPLEQRLTLPDGTRLLAVHASPGTDDGDGVHPGRERADLDAMLQQSDADLIIVGHTHEPQDYVLDSGRIINPGSVGNPISTDLRAAYAILEASPTGYNVELKRAAYDVPQVFDHLKKLRHPNIEYIMHFYSGSHQSVWRK